MNALIFVFCAVVAIVAAAPAAPEEPIAIISQVSELNPDGSYVNKFETANGISVSEEGSTKVVDKEEVQVAEGISSYTAPDGTEIKTVWKADETGFHASGPHIPVGPETPAYIARSLEWNAAHPEEELEEKSYAKTV